MTTMLCVVVGRRSDADRGTGVSGCDWDSSLAQGPETVVPAPREGWWMELHNRFLERAKKGKVDLLFLGDSITQGWNDNEVWQRFYGPRNAANFGIGGDRTEHVLWRIQHGELEGIEPKVAVLMIGTNNVSSSTPDEIAQGITAIVKELRSRLPKTKILLLGVFPRGEKPLSVRERLKSVNEKNRQARRWLACQVPRHQPGIPQPGRNDLARTSCPTICT